MPEDDASLGAFLERLAASQLGEELERREEIARERMREHMRQMNETDRTDAENSAFEQIGSSRLYDGQTIGYGTRSNPHRAHNDSDCSICRERGEWSDYHELTGGKDVYYAGKKAEVICPSCIEQYTRKCGNCGSYVVGNMPVVKTKVVNNGERTEICGDCFNKLLRTHNISQCRRSGMYTTADEGLWLGDNFFHEDYADELTPRELTMRYNYKPDMPVFVNSLADRSTDGPKTRATRYVGLEIEVDCGDRNAFMRDTWQKARKLEYDNLFYFMHDGSLSDAGIEITTAPIEIGCALHEYPFDFLAEQAKLFGMRSHNTKTCGLHTHFSKASLDGGDLTLAKLLLLFDKFYNELCRFGRRMSKSQAQHWCDRPNANILKTDRGNRLSEKMERSGYNHYKAVNLSPRTTVEFRLWKGTTNPNTLRATVDFMNALITICDTTALPELYDYTWPDLMRKIVPMVQLEKTLEYIATRGLLKEF